MSLSKNDFGTISDGTIRQSHSFWNEAKFSIECIINGLGNYGSKPIIRTATLLTSTGEVKLYAVKNADEESYSINLPIFQNKILTAGYILQH